MLRRSTLPWWHTLMLLALSMLLLTNLADALHITGNSCTDTPTDDDRYFDDTSNLDALPFLSFDVDGEPAGQFWVDSGYGIKCDDTDNAKMKATCDHVASQAYLLSVQQSASHLNITGIHTRHVTPFSHAARLHEANPYCYYRTDIYCDDTPDPVDDSLARRHNRLGKSLHSAECEIKRLIPIVSSLYANQENAHQLQSQLASLIIKAGNRILAERSRKSDLAVILGIAICTALVVGSCYLICNRMSSSEPGQAQCCWWNNYANNGRHRGGFRPHAYELRLLDGDAAPWSS